MVRGNQLVTIASTSRQAITPTNQRPGLISEPGRAAAHNTPETTSSETPIAWIISAPKATCS